MNKCEYIDRREFHEKNNMKNNIINYFFLDKS